MRSVLICALLVSIVYSQTCKTSGGLGNNLYCNSWMINTAHTSSYFSNAKTDCQDVTEVTLNNVNYIQATCTGIPQYDVVITQDDVNFLNSRPKASTDFTNGHTSAYAGETVSFGQSIGYANTHCTLGYWPPGPSCPTASNKAGKFRMNPVQNTGSPCYTTLGSIGYWVNGVSIYNWWDGTSYNNANVWHTMAMDAEFYDLDICTGHAANGDYHHHGFPNCLAKLLNDDGSKKSPIYGFAADGVPVMGPWTSAGVLAKSCWQERDYDSIYSNSGCGADYKRTCLLVDNLDISKGTVAASHAGPDTNSQVLTQSGNVLNATSGFYFEDYYYNSTCTTQGNDYLDQYNGRYDSDYGYVYHVTIEDPYAEVVTTVFPHFIGPFFYGTLDSNTICPCSTTMFQGGGGGVGAGCCPDGSQPSSGNPPCKTGPPSPIYCPTGSANDHHH